MLHTFHKSFSRNPERSLYKYARSAFVYNSPYGWTIGAIFLQPNQFVLSQLLVIAQDTCVLIIKLPADRAYQWGSSKLGYWRIAGSPVLKCSITNKRLVAAGYFSIPNYYEFLHSCGWTAMYRSVRTVMWEAGSLRRTSYSFTEKMQSLQLSSR